MIAENIITKQKFNEFLKKVIIDKDDAAKLMLLFEIVNDKSIHEKIMFLLYNEYIELDYLLAALKTDTIGLIVNNEMSLETKKTKIIDSLNKILSSIVLDSTDFGQNINTTSNLKTGIYFKDIDGTDVVYNYIKHTFFRDLVTTLTWEHYKDYKNITEQLDVVYLTLTAEEKYFLSNVLFIDNLIPLVRIQIDTNLISLAQFELAFNQIAFNKTFSSNETVPSLKYISHILNYDRPKIIDGETDSDYYFIMNDDENRAVSKKECLLSILNKISMGTIH